MTDADGRLRTMPGLAWHARGVWAVRRVVALLEAVRAQQPSGPQLVTFFAVMYYAGLGPEEAINLAADNVILPPPGRPEAED